MKNKIKQLFLATTVLSLVLATVPNLASAQPNNITSTANDTTVTINWEETSMLAVSDYAVEFSLDNSNWFPSPYPTTNQPTMNLPRPITYTNTTVYIRIVSEYVDTSTSAPVTGTIIIPGITFANSSQFTAGTPSVVVTDAARKADGLPYWLDGTMGIFERNGQIISLSSNGTRTARIVADQDNLYGTVTDTQIEIQNQALNSDFASGGPVYYDEPNDRLLMFYHGELHQPDAVDFYSYIGMAQSLDGGETFEDLGQIIKPYIDINNPSRSGAVETGGAPYIIRDGYFYVYFKDKRPDNSVVNLGVARASVTDVLSAADTGTTPTWQKYSNGSFSVNAIGNEDPGNEPDDLLENDPYAIWTDVAYIEELDKFVMVYASNSNGNGWATFITTSDDGIEWDKPEFLFEGATVAEELSYITISSTDYSDQKNIVGNQFYVYRTVSASAPGGFRWDDAWQERYTVSFDVLSATTQKGALASKNGELAATGTKLHIVLPVGISALAACLVYGGRRRKYVALGHTPSL